MAAVGSPEWLPPGFTAKIKYKEGRKVKFFVNVATGKKYYSKKEVIQCASEDSSQLVTLQTKNGDDNGPSINNDEPISDRRYESTTWLPFGWTVEERKRKSGPAEGSAYKVYTDLSSGSKYYSKAAVFRHIRTVDPDYAGTILKENKVSPTTNTGNSNTRGNKRKANSLENIENVDEPVPEKSPQIISTTTGSVHKRSRKGNSPAMIDNVSEPLPDASPQVISTTNTDGISRKKRKSSSFVTVSIERTTPADLPSGWIKEIRTSKSGSKMRTDPFYTDPVSGYMFRSKPDALRYLKTNDIRSCACRPMKRDSDDIKLNENKSSSSNPANEKQLFSGEEPNGGVETSGTKSPAEPKTKISKRKQAKHDSAKVVQERVTRRNSYKDAKMGDSPKPEGDLSKNGAIGSPVTAPSTKQQFPESGGRNKTGLKKPKKRSGSSLPLRSSKRLAGSEPEMQSNLDLSERSRRAAARGSTDSNVDASPSFPAEAPDSVPQTSNIEPAKEAADHAIMDVETHRLKESEKPPTESSAIPEEPAGEKASENEKPPTESSAIREEPSGEKASEKPLDDGQRLQESQLCYDFGDSWSDPLEFALKTLRGELPIEDTLTFPGCFGEQFDTTCLKQQPQFVPPTNLQSELAPKSDSSKINNVVDPLPASSLSLENLGFSSYSTINLQPSKDVVKKDSQTKFNP